MGVKMKSFSVSEEGGQDGTGPLSGGASQCPPLANPIQGHTEHVQELCKAGGEGSGGIDSGGSSSPPCFL